MHQISVVERDQLLRAIVWAFSMALLGSGCSLSLAAGDCNQTDSTESCCLKEHPGEYERCAAMVPVASQPQLNRLLPGDPGVTGSAAAPIPELPTRKEKEKWRDLCMDYYTRCIGAGGAGTPGRKWKETQCQACYDACQRHGFWPLRANEKPCPGA